MERAEHAERSVGRSAVTGQQPGVASPLRPTSAGVFNWTSWLSHYNDPQSSEAAVNLVHYLTRFDVQLMLVRQDQLPEFIAVSDVVWPELQAAIALEKTVAAAESTGA